jgi:peptidoglycan/LPS O-acetylase OafA/YrhL
MKKMKLEDFRFNLLKGFCILGVVCIHFGGSFVRRDNVWTDSFYLGLGLNQFFSFAVPTFIFLSGWLLQMTYGSRTLDWKAFYRRRLIKLGIPYLLVTVAYFVFFRETWIIQQLTIENFLPRFLYYGIEPTLYFVPLIFQLYLLFPLLKKMDDRIDSGKDTNGSIQRGSGVLGLFFLLHIVIGYLAYSGVINYHWLCLRFFAFWLFYFYAGMQFRRLWTHIVSERYAGTIAIFVLSLAFLLFVWDMYVVTDPSRVGAFYERAMLDFAYSRPEILPYNLLVVFGIGFLLLMQWKISMSALEYVGKYSYHIYVWHIPVLLRIGWEKPEIITLCIQYPEMILVMVIFVAGLISFFVSLAEQDIRCQYRNQISSLLLRLRMAFDRC